MSINSGQVRKVKNIQMWLKRCRDNIVNFRNNSHELDNAQAAAYIRTQYSFLSAISSVLHGKAFLSGVDRYLFEKESKEKSRDRWEQSKKEYYNVSDKVRDSDSSGSSTGDGSSAVRFRGQPPVVGETNRESETRRNVRRKTLL